MTGCVGRMAAAIGLAVVLLLSPVAAPAVGSAPLAQGPMDVSPLGGGEAAESSLSPMQSVLVFSLSAGWVVAFAVVVVRSTRRASAARAARTSETQG